MAEFTLIKWLDSAGKDGWQHEDELPEPCEITTLGFLVKETDDAVWVSCSKVTNGEQWAQVMVIPTYCILERWEVQIK